MIEVNLISVPTSDPEAMVGRLVARSRFDKEAMGINVMQFVKGFLKNNLEKFETELGNADLVSFINSDALMSTVDFATMNYYLGKVGYAVKIWNVADDEENSVTIPVDSVEWNILNRNFVQYDYATATKIMPADGNDMVGVLKQAVEQSGLFDVSKFAGAVNPFNVLVNNLEHIKEVSGQVNGTIVSKIYQILDQCGFSVYCITSED